VALLLACSTGDDPRDSGPATIGSAATGGSDDGATFGGDTTSGPGATTGGADGPATACTPGQQVECACPLGIEGAQACKEDGSGYEPCQCPLDDGTSGPGTGDISGGTGSTCDEGDCLACQQCVYLDACADAADACVMSDGCNELLMCYSECMGDPTCFETCDAAAPDEAHAALQALSDCILAQCPISCGGA
jgi:hypothetical protein